MDDLIKEVKRFYVFPDLAVKVEAALRSHQRSGSYDKISSGRALSAAVTRDLMAVTNDKHLKLRYSESAIPFAWPGARTERGRACTPARLQPGREFRRGARRAAAWQYWISCAQ